MTNQEFENYLALLSRLLRLKREQADKIAGELRDHLELRIAELTESGVETSEATRVALEEFGDAASLAGQFQLITNNSQRRWMMRFATLSVAALFMVAILAMAMWPEGARFGSPDFAQAENGGNGLLASAGQPLFQEVTMSDSTRRSNELRKLLEVDSYFDEEETPFQDIMSRLQEDLKINVFLSETAANDALTRDEPITFSINKAPLKQALRLMLEQYNATYVVDGGVLKIISRDVENDPEFFVRRMYDVKELLSKIEELEPHRTGMVPFQMRYGFISNGGGGFGGGGGGGGGGGASRGGGLFSVQEVGQTHAEQPQVVQSQQPQSPLPTVASQAVGGNGQAEAKAESGARMIYVSPEDLFIATIEETIASDEWDHTGGSGTIKILGGLMIVNQSEAINDQIHSFLQDLEYRYTIRSRSSD